MPPKSLLRLTLLLLQGGLSLSAQEPGVFQGSQAARFQVGPDVYHYVIPCGSEKPGESHEAKNLCWPVRVSKVQLVDGKRTSLPMGVGSIFVSSQKLRLTVFAGNEKKLEFEAASADVSSQYDPHSQSAYFFTKQEGYQFVFLNTCALCMAGTAPPPLDSGKLEQEYKLFGKSLRNFEDVAAPMIAMGKQMRIEVTPHNQPNLSDHAGAMELYGSLNRKLAGQCMEPAKSCVAQYARYEFCEAGNDQSGCGPPPSCSATCDISSAQLKEYKATTCQARGRDSFTLIPDWSEVFTREEASRAANLSKVVVIHRETPEQQKSRLDAVSDNVCGVAQSYQTLSMSHMVSSRATLQQTPQTTTIIGTDGVAHVPPMILKDYLLTNVLPIYPAAAQMAHVVGIVVLNVVISKEGQVTDVTAMSGPEMLRPAAIDAVRQWKYKPFVNEGVAHEVSSGIAVRFAAAK